MSSGSFSRRGFRFEPIATLKRIVDSVENGKTPIEVEFNPKLPGEPDCLITYADRQTDWIQIKSRSIGQGHWTPMNEEIVKAIFNFCIMDDELSKAIKAGAYTNHTFLFFLEGDPNGKFNRIIDAIKTQSDPESLELILNQSARWIQSGIWKPTVFNHTKVASTVMKISIVPRLDKQLVEDLLFGKMGSFYHEFMILESEKDKLEANDIHDIIEYVSSRTNKVQESLANLQKSKLPRKIQSSLEYLIRERIILFFSHDNQKTDIENAKIDGIIHTQEKSFLLLYSEQIIRGHDLVHLVTEKVIPSKREAIIIAANVCSIVKEGIHLVDIDSQTLDNDLLKIMTRNE